MVPPDCIMWGMEYAWLCYLVIHFHLLIILGHEGEISKALFNPQGTKILTAGADGTARLWDAETGEMLQVLSNHTDEIFSCQFNYEGEIIITGSKDNNCNIWKDELA